MSQSFAVVLHDLRQGDAEIELNEALHEAAVACAETGKSASITVTLTLSPMGQGRVKVADKINLKKAEPSKEDTLFFLTEAGTLTRRNPRQLDMQEEFNATR